MKVPPKRDTLLTWVSHSYPITMTKYGGVFMSNETDMIYCIKTESGCLEYNCWVIQASSFDRALVTLGDYWEATYGINTSLMRESIIIDAEEVIGSENKPDDYTSDYIRLRNEMIGGCCPHVIIDWNDDVIALMEKKFKYFNRKVS